MLNIARIPHDSPLQMSASWNRKSRSLITTHTCQNVNKRFTCRDHLGLSKVLEKLNKEQRTIIDLVYYKDAPSKEIIRYWIFLWAQQN